MFGSSPRKKNAEGVSFKHAVSHAALETRIETMEEIAYKDEKIRQAARWRSR
ncbi:MAG: hypothetical protein IKM91_09695 [Candidatus Methanomethylophilaceae archaeon]|nr:hypothetical protein [Candidatus Methanomethylophilaceae archaeon]MBR6038415.1 hypothetical protein [Candidatus Methanomethylophilaceae archaeon]MBR6871863.1 hypothetical protein [Candidatus Methanomethylophilaceae archaeon]